MATKNMSAEEVFESVKSEVQGWLDVERKKLEAIDAELKTAAKPDEVKAQLDSLADRISKRIDGLEARGQLHAEQEAKTDFAGVLEQSEAFAAMLKSGVGPMASKGQGIKIPSLLNVKSRLAVKSLLDSTDLGDLSRPYYRDGIVYYPRRRPRIVELVRRESIGSSEVSRFNKESSKSANAGVRTRLDGEIAANAVSAVLVSVDRLMAGQVLRFHGASLKEVTIDTIDASTRTVNWTGAVGAIIADGSDVTCRFFGATPEGSRKPYTMLAAPEQTLSLQTISLLVQVTEQRLRSPRLLPWLVQALPVKMLENLNYHLVYGRGIPGELHGFFAAADLQTNAWSDGLYGDNMADALLSTSDLIVSSGMLTAGMCRADWRKITAAKDSTGNYVHGADRAVSIVNTPVLKAIGDVEVADDDVFESGDYLVADFAAASEIHYQDDATTISLGQVVGSGITAAHSGNDFAENKIHFRIEETLEHAILSERSYAQGEWDEAPADPS